MGELQNECSCVENKNRDYAAFKRLRRIYWGKCLQQLSSKLFFFLSKNKAINRPDVVILLIILNGFGFAIWKCCVKADLPKCYSRMHKTAIE